MMQSRRFLGGTGPVLLGIAALAMLRSARQPGRGTRLPEALKKAKVESYFVTVDGGSHGGFRNPEIQKRQQQFFHRHLRGVQATISEEKIPNQAP